jgi:hypothetical protein
MSDNSNAGWHIDPHDPTRYRYFDGTAWTEHTAPVYGSPTTVDPYAPYGPYGAAVPATRTNLSRISMILSLVSLGGLVIGWLGPMAIAGLIVGIVASRREPENRSAWLTGIIVGAAVIVLFSVAVVVAVVVFSNTHRPM